MRPNAVILPRFLLPEEAWDDAVDRVSQLAPTSDVRASAESIRRGEFLPAGQIWRGAGQPGASLYNCFACGTFGGEPASNIADRVTRITQTGTGVGVNVSEWCYSNPDPATALLTVLTAVGKSQEGLWSRGVYRTATMLNVDAGLHGIADACDMLSSSSVYRHINIGVLVPDGFLTEAHSAFLTNASCGQLNDLRRLAVCAWQSGNPGFIFTDRVNRDHPFPTKVITCNPCAEQHLDIDEGCLLGSINVAAFVRGGNFDWEAFRYTVRLGVRFLDSAVDQSAFWSDEAALLARTRRRVGLGITGLAATLELMTLDYATSKAVEFSESLAACMRRDAQDESATLAQRAGSVRANVSRRNSHLLSIAPTGAISRLWNLSTGIEPFFSIADVRRFNLSSSAHIKTAPIATEISSGGHLQMTAAWQKYVDGGISKTVNLPTESSVDDILRLLFVAWKADLKGISVFRRGSRVAPRG
jgi:ribonucleoside-diphosphate reductase alpha chain